jgi:predicted CXXCH cytochrome family protein
LLLLSLLGNFRAAPRRRPGSRLVLLRLLLVTAAIAMPGLTRAGEITILAPPAEASVVVSRNRIVKVVVKVVEAGDLDKLHLYSAKAGRSYSPDGRHEQDGIFYLHYSLHLEKGDNVFTLDPGGRSIRLKFKPLSTLLSADFSGPTTYLFHRREVSPPVCRGCHPEKIQVAVKPGPAVFGQTSPECYGCHQSTTLAAEWPHSPTARLLCRACHPEGEGVKVAIPTGKVEDLCFTCHINEKKWPTLAHIHGPVGTGDCTICHDPHGGNNPNQLWADGKGRLCVICHEDKKKYLAAVPQQKLRVHGILTARGCVICHSPHASDHRFQLPAEINELCTSCHTALQGLASGHPSSGHPLKGVADPLRPGTPFSCTSCHNPHGSDFGYLLIGDNRGGLVCAKCHAGGQRKNRYGR